MNKFAMLYMLVSLISFVTGIINHRFIWFMLGLMWLGASIRQIKQNQKK